MLLLASAVALLVHLAVVSPRHVRKSGVIQQNLNRIYDPAEKCSASHTKVRNHLISTPVFIASFLNLFRLLMLYFVLPEVLI